jgi:polysaccharide deacetylase family protein (PEP-CTERM system associated)
MKQTSSQIIITVDLEDWFQVSNLRSFTKGKNWEEFPLRVKTGTEVLLSLFSKYNVKATFFVLGWIAKQLPSLINDIAAQGHEIASHGISHKSINELSHEQLVSELSQSKKLLEEITGKQIYGFRAPNFSINKLLIQELKNCGYIYDSSYNNFSFNKRYGLLEGDWLPEADSFLRNSNGLIELPISNMNIKKFPIPMGGGAYFRLWPTFIFEKAVSRILLTNNYYLFYCHPWEFDPGQPKATGIGFNHYFRHYSNLAKSKSRLEHFLKVFQDKNFNTCYSAIKDYV